MGLDGAEVEQLTFDERVNWFPHVSPDGRRLAYLSFPPGTLGHPADLDVVIRVMDPHGGPATDLVTLFGVFLGIVLLGDDLHANDVVALVLIVAALAIGRLRKPVKSEKSATHT